MATRRPAVPAAEAGAAETGVRGLPYLGAAALSAGLSALAAALYFGGALDSTAPWLDGSGGLTRGGLPIAKLVGHGAAAVTVGLLLACTVLPPGKVRHHFRRAARRSAAVWTAATLVTAVLSVSYLLGEPVSAISVRDLLSYLTDLTQGRALVAVALLTLMVMVARRAALALALLALLPQVVTGHSATTAEHSLAVFSLAVHVVAAALWVGGLVALIALAGPGRDLLAGLVPRFSTLAALCLAAVAVSGLVNAWLRVGGLGAFTGTHYGLLVLAKTTALGCLAALGWWHRRTTIPALARGSVAAFVRLASVEVIVMAAALGLAVGLSRSEPPAAESGPASQAGILLGFELPGPPSLAAYVFDWRIDPLLFTSVTGAAVLYVIWLRRTAREWPWWRTLAWLAGLSIVLVVGCGGLARYSMVLFSAHVAQHLALTLVAPVFLLIGAPPAVVRRPLHPIAALALLVISLYGFYGTPIFEASLRNHLLHSLTMAGFVVVGLVCLPSTPRVLLLCFHVAFGIALLKATGVIAGDWYAALGRTWGTSALHDQRTAALVVFAATLAVWSPLKTSGGSPAPSPGPRNT